MPREVVWGRRRAPWALASAVKASVCRHSSGSAKVLVRLKVNGRPDARLMAAIRATSRQARPSPGPLAVEPGRAAEDAPAVPAEDLGQGDELPLSGPGARHVAPVGRDVAPGPGGREAQRPGGHRPSTLATMVASSSSVGSASGSSDRSPMAW